MMILFGIILMRLWLKTTLVNTMIKKIIRLLLKIIPAPRTRLSIMQTRQLPRGPEHVTRKTIHRMFFLENLYTASIIFLFLLLLVAKDSTPVSDDTAAHGPRTLDPRMALPRCHDRGNPALPAPRIQCALVAIVIIVDEHLIDKIKNNSSTFASFSVNALQSITACLFSRS